MSRTISILRLAPLALALACEAAGGADTSDQPVDENDDGEPASSSEPTGGDPTGPAADFGPGPVFECDPWLQDCPEGQKCNLYSTAKSFGDYHYMCLATCDPLAQDCIEGELCALTEKGFACAPDISGDDGQIYDRCTAANDCDRGLACLPPDAADPCPGGPAGGCCLPFCEVGGVCPDALECFGLFDPAVDPEFAAVGACAAPPP